MLFFFVILCLFGVCFGEKKPELAETFQANVKKIVLCKLIMILYLFRSLLSCTDME